MQSTKRREIALDFHGLPKPVKGHSMIIGHLPVGYLAACASEPAFGRDTVIWWSLLAGSVVPDLDMLWFFFIDHGAVVWGWAGFGFSGPLVVVPATQDHWILSFLVHWTFGVELVLTAIALIVLWRRRVKVVI
jgi:inner membrane protein